MAAESPPDPDGDHDAQLAVRLTSWQPDHVGTLVFVVDADHVLLMHKKRGHGAGRLNGPGGKIEAGETPEQCAIRETREEVLITPLDLRLAGRFRFVECSGPQWYGYIFVSRAFTGTPGETDEGRPIWFPVDALPFDRMWEDDRLWLPRVLAGETLDGDFLFDDARLLAHRIRSVS